MTPIPPQTTAIQSSQTLHLRKLNGALRKVHLTQTGAGCSKKQWMWAPSALLGMQAHLCMHVCGLDIGRGLCLGSLRSENSPVLLRAVLSGCLRSLGVHCRCTKAGQDV